MKSTQVARSLARPIGVAFLVILLASACGDDDGASTPDSTGAAAGSTTLAPTTTAAPEKCTADKAGGELTMGMFGQIAGLDPLSGTNNGVNGGTERTALYDTLVRYDTTTGQYEPWVASKLESNADSSEWTLTLRDNVKFGTGNPLTADAVVASIKRHQSDANRTGSKFLAQQVAEVTAKDAKTVVFKLTRPWATFAALLSDSPGQIIDATVLDKLGPQQFPLNPAGAGVGPYEIVRFAPGEVIEMQAKKDYWGGPVCIQKLKFVAIPGAMATYEAFKTNTMQMAFVREAPVVDQADKDKAILYRAIQSAGNGFALNNKPGNATADVRVRKAMALALDPTVISQRVYQGTAKGTTALIDPTSRFATKAMQPLTTNAQQAAALVQEAKAAGWNGKLTLLCNNSPSSVNTAITAKTLLDAVGFDVTTDTSKPTATVIGAVQTSRSYEAACWGWSIADENPWIALEKNFASTSGSNPTGYADKDFDAGLDALRTAKTLQQQQAALEKLMARWNETIPSLATETVTEAILAKPNVKGVTATNYTTMIFSSAYLAK
jgi:peptide/nickel transport system substrate-binding protein